jgi:hypothetical protein
MAVPSLLRALLAIVKLLLSSCIRLANDTRVGLLRKMAYLWALLRIRLLRANPIDRKKDQEPSPPPAIRPACDDLTERRTTETTTITTAHDDVIPLDSSISCSLHPYPYMNRSNASRASLHHGLHVAARSVHSSRNASRSRSTQQSETHSYQDAFSVKSPVASITRRRWSLPSPGVGSKPGSQGQGVGVVESPVESIAGLPAITASVSSIHAESLLQDLRLGHERIFPIVPEFFQRYDRKAFVSVIRIILSLQ